MSAQCECIRDLIDGKSTVIPKYAIAEKIFSDAQFTEGPASDLHGNIYFSDLTFTYSGSGEQGHIYKYNIINNSVELFMSPSRMSNGLLFDLDDNLLICEGADTGGRRIIKFNTNSETIEIIADNYNGKAFNSPNDLAMDINGNIYFTDPRYTGDEEIEQPVNGVYRIDTTGNVTCLIDNISMPNGIAISPDQQKLYVGCFDESIGGFHENGGVYTGTFILEFDMVDDSLRFSKKFFEFWEEVGPDGLTIDTNGNIYAAVRNENDPAVWVFNPGGEVLELIHLPEVPSNVEFGRGNSKRILYITAGSSLYRIDTSQKGFHPADM
ncbi:MAG: SMP-30/gluconolactonase/LRE family protein [Melioribacteraceae bacterium]|nr:SMP-30/gluconolactonase/LRE family protein [Melioribacteraceae bacterium]MCF8353541.1 SMP-30/gluconolactonase/LRE family protein [Melioribacteraceae bacterium]MCF8392525.1 SMP-30/gluconolactonase/LRE family protein [Melioribacteraceae bacterium]